MCSFQANSMKVARTFSLSSVLCVVIGISGVAGTCTDPGSLQNGVVDYGGSAGKTGNEYHFGSILEFSCNENYTIWGSRLMACSRFGWLPSVMPVCNAHCFEPEPLPNGRYEANFPVNGFDGTVKLMCDEGYSLSGAHTIACTNGSYINYQPGVTSKCEANCDMTALPNARITGSNVNRGVAIVKCKAGFTPSDDYKVFCRDGQWSGQMPVCEDLLSEYIAVYFPFENDFRDASSNGRDGAQVQTVSFAENMGVSGSAAWFTGDGRVEVQTEFLTNNNFSVSLWFKQTNNVLRKQGLVSLQGYGDVKGSELVLSGTENQVLYAGVATPGEDDRDYVDIAATSNHWHHALYTYDGTEFNLYFDGEKQNRFSNCCMESMRPLVGHSPLRIGQTGEVTLTQYFYGLIDEVYIFNMALNETTALMMCKRDTVTSTIICVPTVKCFEPEPIPNGRYEADFPVSGVNGTVKVLCNEGFSLAGADTITCTNGSYVNYQPGVTSKCKVSSVDRRCGKFSTNLSMKKMVWCQRSYIIGICRLVGDRP
ncbi:uncharacterized protein [Ptychodera flava]|uniref:uncharacterized protein n=1 Tax=Ptychodera flava TaxID=63121 RepID=UPI00396A0343